MVDGPVPATHGQQRPTVRTIGTSTEGPDRPTIAARPVVAGWPHRGSRVEEGGHGLMVATPPTLLFSTRAVPPSARATAMQTLHERGLLPVEALPGARPAVDLVKWQLPGVSALSGRFVDVRQVGRADAQAGDELFFGINLVGACLVRQRGQEPTIGVGDAVAIALAAGPFTVLRPGPTRMLGLRLPRPATSTYASEQDARRVDPAVTPALGLLTGYLRTLLVGPAPTAELADVVADHIRALTALAIGTDPASALAGRPSLRAARLTTVKADIDQHLTDPGLAAATVAARHGISVRQLHRLFELDGRTYSRYVLDRRLQLVRQRLRHPRYAGESITSLAAGAGFADPSYFNRTFRRRYGTTPSEVRHDAEGWTPDGQLVARRGPAPASPPASDEPTVTSR
jgi:AraC-like DNA-binding protein